MKSASGVRSGRGLPATTRVATSLARLASSASRWAGIGGGSVIGGRVALAIDSDVLRALTAGRTVALVSGTNGKTTTTRLLARALEELGTVATSTAGSNMPAGLVSALMGAKAEASAVLEVDEGYLPEVMRETCPSVVLLLNLSRDQLDRVSEVRMLARRWALALEATRNAGEGSLQVVANADDPMVAWAASRYGHVTWVAAGSSWKYDATSCPACEVPLHFDGEGGWACECGFARPRAHWSVSGTRLFCEDGRRFEVGISLPGRFNTSNAAMAAVAAEALGVEVGRALAAMASVESVEGRFALIEHRGSRFQLLLSKNPAGWSEIIDLLVSPAYAEARLVFGINARVADGTDPSWLWDVPFERLAGREVVATGERWRDLAVRLDHAGARWRAAPNQLAALDMAGAEQLVENRSSRPSVYVGNYTAFQDLRRALRGASGTRRRWLRPMAKAASLMHEGGGAPSAGMSIDPARPSGIALSAGAAPASEGDGGNIRPSPLRDSALRVVAVYPDLLGTYGDVGNAVVLVNRARWRGMDAELVLATCEAALPREGDIYCIGGGEDAPQSEAAALLRASGALGRAIERGAAVLAVCAGFQLAGESFPGADGSVLPGLGLLDARTRRASGPRAVGEILVEATGNARKLLEGSGSLARGRSAGQPARGPATWLTGFENHAGVTELGTGCEPLGRVLVGKGNYDRAKSDGALFGRFVGTYMHGPVLARNPALADAMIELATGVGLSSLEDQAAEELHRERVASVRRLAGRARLGLGLLGLGLPGL
jgi:CobQ-like glutamine amidotransferase family enzyme/UDP-N-acetylmuramyl tripeptide synthase